MNTVIPVEVPEEFRKLIAKQRGEANLPQWASEALVIEAVREGLISRRKAAELLGIDGELDRDEFFARSGLIEEYTPEMLEQDRKSYEELIDR